MAEMSESTRRPPSQENLMLDYVHRLDQHKDGRLAVHVRLSELRPFNRREQHVRAAANIFEPMVKDLQGQLFVTRTSDLFFFYKQDAGPFAEMAIQKIRFMFSDDPLLVEESPDEPQFSIFYNVDDDYDAILHLAQGLVDTDQPSSDKLGGGKPDTRADIRNALKAKQEKGEVLTPATLARIETSLERADLSNMVRRQFVCTLTRKLVPEPVFSELFISIANLRETLLPDVDLASNRWLFMQLTETLDRRMLSMLGKTDTFTLSGEISFNLNVSTMLSAEFQEFDDAIAAGRRGSMIIELQKVDVFADLGAYLFAREYLQAKGYRICLDGMSYQALSMINRTRIGFDLVKLNWTPDMADANDETHQHIRDMVKSIGEERVVLCRVDTREAIDFGQSMGITHYQGRHIENLIAEDNRRRELLRLKRRIERS